MPADEAYDFFVSYRGVDRERACQVAESLEAHGWRAIIQERDFSSWSFVEDKEKAFRRSKAMAAVLTRHYLTSGFTQHEYQTACFLSRKEGSYKVVVLAFDPWPADLDTTGVTMIDLREMADDRDRWSRVMVEELRRAGYYPAASASER